MHEKAASCTNNAHNAALASFLGMAASMTLEKTKSAYFSLKCQNYPRSKGLTHRFLKK